MKARLTKRVALQTIGILGLTGLAVLALISAPPTRRRRSPCKANPHPNQSLSLRQGKHPRRKETCAWACAPNRRAAFTRFPRLWCQSSPLRSAVMTRITAPGISAADLTQKIPRIT